MLAFVVTGMQPRSVGAQHTARWKRHVSSSFRSSLRRASPLTGDLYGVVYYFHRRPTQLDADNLSKPVLDALEGLAYDDDRQVRVRYAGTSNQSDFAVLDISRVPDTVFDDLLAAVNHADHAVYVEVGRLHASHFRFGCEVS